MRLRIVTNGETFRVQSKEPWWSFCPWETWGYQRYRHGTGTYLSTGGTPVDCKTLQEAKEFAEEIRRDRRRRTWTVVVEL